MWGLKRAAKLEHLAAASCTCLLCSSSSSRRGIIAASCANRHHLPKLKQMTATWCTYLLTQQLIAAEVPQLPAVRTVTTCRALIVSREAYRQIAASYPLSARAVLENLMQDCEQVCLPPCAVLLLYAHRVPQRAV